MGTSTLLRQRFPRLVGQAGRPVEFFSRIGDHILFYGRAVAGVPHATLHFRKEIVRLIAEISMGAGTLAMTTVPPIIASVPAPIEISAINRTISLRKCNVACGTPATARP